MVAWKKKQGFIVRSIKTMKGIEGKDPLMSLQRV